MIIGVDYASVDGNTAPDFAKAREAGLKFVYIRATWGAWKDPCVERDVSAAHATGLDVGLYAFLRFDEHGVAAPPVKAQVEAFHTQVSAAYPYLTLPSALDVEFPGRGLVDTGLTPQAALNWVEDAAILLGNPMIYTSARVWAEDLKNRPAEALGHLPLWVKTPYVVRARQPVTLAGLAADVSSGLIPPPWHGRAWIQQFQGDAVGFPGFSSTVDVNRFLPYRDTPGDTSHHDPRADWVHSRLAGRSIQAYQEANGLVPDGVVGPKTFAVLARR